MKAHELLFSQILNCNSLFDCGVISPRHERQPIIEELLVYEGVQLNRQPVDGYVGDAVAEAVLEANWPRDSVET